ncbi:UDP-N-acetyl glucosamine 2-epimerase [Myxococcota bacterium]|nr:UDP-N-acetyl glucosamine 2-epimerase [Myxococcota bacterium]MBU1537716.1 UDP-N-acetyl glucosamine 2-epimerase [Myxococcota bacterium]
MKVCFYPTTMQGDIYAMAQYYQEKINSGSNDEMLLVVDDYKDFLEEPVCRHLPFNVEFVERSSLFAMSKIKKFDPDFLFIDNHIPSKKVFRNLVYLWHGFGWKEQRADIEFVTVHEQLDKLVGGVREPNPHFIHQTYGQFEKDHRWEFTKFHPENCLNMGMLYSDMLMKPKVSREEIAAYYPFEHKDRKTVLLGFTWGFGEVFKNWDMEEEAILSRLFSLLAERETNVIFRLHDKKRYEPRYLSFLEEISSRYGNIYLKYKNVGRDNYFDVLLSDLIVSNFSGIVVYAYFTGVPSIHIHPYGLRDDTDYLLRFRRKKQMVDTSAKYMWKMGPEENGGMLARSAEQFFSQVEKALDDRDCCRDISKKFNEKYMETSTGATCENLDRYLTQWHGGTKPSPW